jgi:hypothetical protein
MPSRGLHLRRIGVGIHPGGRRYSMRSFEEACNASVLLPSTHLAVYHYIPADRTQRYKTEFDQHNVLIMQHFDAFA